MKILVNTLIALFIFINNVVGQERVIVDVDAGIDDYQGLVLLIDADFRNMVKIEAIYLTDGNAKLNDVTNNVMRLLETCGRTDIPVYKGYAYKTVPRNISSDNYYGVDGFGDLNYTSSPNLEGIQKMLSPGALFTIIKDNPKEITVIALGPLTNVATTLRMYSNVSELIKQIYVMGGNYGEQTQPEFNFLLDPESVYSVFQLSTVPIYMLPFQTCSQSTLGWRFEQYISNPVFHLMDKAERSAFAHYPDTDTWKCCDGVTVAAFLHPELVTKQNRHVVEVVLDPQEDRALVIESSNGTEVTIFEEISDTMFQRIFLKAMEQICTNDNCNYIYS